jgi:hypothetical protein
MAWYIYLAYFFGGVFLANGVPHFIHGISGQEFSTPFAEPPTESSPVTNVLWGSANFITGFLLISTIGHFQLGLNMGSLMVALGAFLTSLALAWNFQRRYE